MVDLFSVAKAVRRVVLTLLRGWTENVKLLQSLAPHLGDGAGSVSHVANNNWLVGGLEHFLFSHILGITIPID